jgi:hypothetical protein
MRAALLCPRCRQPIRFERLGVRLTERKAAIFDAIKAAPGISALELAYGFDHPVSKDTVKSHIFQINSMLEETDRMIVGARGRYGGYSLERRRPGVVRQSCGERGVVPRKNS